MNDLIFAVLRQANVARLPVFKNSRGAFCHNHDGSDWSLSQWLQAIAGEMGEYANVRKKFDRADITEEEFRAQASKELADVFIYTDLFAFRCGIQLESILQGDNFSDVAGRIDRATRSPIGNGVMDDRSGAAIAEAFLVAQRELSRLSKRTILRAGEIRSKPMIGERLLDFLHRLFVLAQVNDIDLGAAVQQKFNEVSGRVKAEIYVVKRKIDDDDNEAWIIDNVPF